ncbi:MAG: DUF5060 domain-containing protein [bacterium]|nr:DUF5060 domain-containing protein [bacterium]
MVSLGYIFTLLWARLFFGEPFTRNKLYGLALIILGIVILGLGKGTTSIEGEARVWHTITISFAGPEASQTDDAPNPFLDYRLQVLFQGPSGQSYNVPGFFDGDGQGGPSGNVWRVRFTPDEAGRWRYAASLRKGDGIGISIGDDAAGDSVSLDAASGTLDIKSRDPAAPGFLKWGRLEYAGGHYLKFRDGGHWLRGGTDSPENFLAYAGFDNTPPNHRYADHLEDWRPGDPDWGDGRGKAIIGALNYLASRQVNSIYFLAMNVGGDGGDVWPWAGQPDPNGNPSNDNLHFDVGKLRQWETVFSHAQRQGIFLHFVLNEAEEQNKRELDDGELGTERKLYYRELIARFSHHLALEWNLCEEYNIGGFDLGHDRVREFARYIQAVDPYHHPITVHSARHPVEELRFTFGDPAFSITSIQLNQRRIDTLVEDLRKATAEAGRPLPVSMDEFTVDVGTNKSHIPVDDVDGQRKQKLWPTYLSGGMIEFILEGMLEVDSFRAGPKDLLWQQVWHARRFVEQLPFSEMEPADELISGGGTIPVGLGGGKAFDLAAQVFAKPGEVYAIYLPTASPAGLLDLSSTQGTFEMRWYNPRSGEFEGQTREVTAGGPLVLGNPPSDAGEDWVALVRKR